jgi:hypothetical protein
VRNRPGSLFLLILAMSSLMTCHMICAGVAGPQSDVVTHTVTHVMCDRHFPTPISDVQEVRSQIQIMTQSDLVGTKALAKLELTGL